MNLPDMGGLFQQAQRMQKELRDVQDDLKKRIVVGESAGGMVKVYTTGQQDVKKVEIEPAAVDPDDLGMLEDLLLVAINASLEKSKQLARDETQRVTGGIDLPGLF
ncbi:MAG: YbaB/EbfC family nucleoid-associated protein [Planctomycetes bacterium]|nr:YbaB/EbfC family nucleoid-associated protein [Planctomycetota bacterium]